MYNFSSPAKRNLPCTRGRMLPMNLPSVSYNMSTSYPLPFAKTLHKFSVAGSMEARTRREDEVSEPTYPALCVDVSRTSPESAPATREHIVRVAYTPCRSCAPDAYFHFQKTRTGHPLVR